MVKTIRPTVWDMNKTEAIDFSQDFRWFDDSPMVSELLEMKKNKAEAKLIDVDLNKHNLQTLLKSALI